MPFPNTSSTYLELIFTRICRFFFVFVWGILGRKFANFQAKPTGQSAVQLYKTRPFLLMTLTVVFSSTVEVDTE